MRGRMDQGEARRLLAAQWWLRLGEEQAPSDDVSAWLEWSTQAPENAEAFVRIQSLAEGLAASDDAARAALVSEFARPGHRQWYRPVALAASLAFLALAGGLGWRQFAVPPAPSAELQRYATTTGINRHVALPDGSEITIGADSAVTTDFNADLRHLRIERGEAFFEVAKEANRSFVVDAGPLQVRALGTAFNIRRTGAQVTVTVAHGRVRIAPMHPSASADDALDAVAGQRVSYDPLTASMRMSAVDSDRILSWRNGRLDFVDEPLGLVVANINRYSHHKLHIQDPDLGALRFTGTVRPEKLAGWLTALPSILPVRLEPRGDDTLITAPR